MAATIDATVGGPAANSYVTLAAAETYFETRLHADDWGGADDDTKNRALIWATRMLDAYTIWNGVVADEDTPQALDWPRDGVYDKNGLAIDTDEIPGAVQTAVYELALVLMGADRQKEPDQKGVKSMEVGSLAFGFDPLDEKPQIPDPIWRMISHLGSRRDGGAKTSFHPIERT